MVFQPVPKFYGSVTERDGSLHAATQVWKDSSTGSEIQVPYGTDPNSSPQNYPSYNEDNAPRSADEVRLSQMAQASANRQAQERADRIAANRAANAPLTPNTPSTGWRRIGSSASGTPVFERTVNGQAERIASERAPLGSERGIPYVPPAPKNVQRVDLSLPPSGSPIVNGVNLYTGETVQQSSAPLVGRTPGGAINAGTPSSAKQRAVGAAQDFGSQFSQYFKSLALGSQLPEQNSTQVQDTLQNVKGFKAAGAVAGVGLGIAIQGVGAGESAAVKGVEVVGSRASRIPSILRGLLRGGEVASAAAKGEEAAKVAKTVFEGGRAVGAARTAEEAAKVAKAAVVAEETAKAAAPTAKTIGEALGFGNAAAKGAKAAKVVEKVVPAAEAATSGAQASKGVAKLLENVDRLSQANRVTRFGRGVATAAVQGEAIRITAERVSNATAPQEQQDVSRIVDVNAGLKAGFAAQAQNAAKRGRVGFISFGAIADQLPFVGGFIDRGKPFENAVTQYFQSQGLQGTQLKAAVAAAQRRRRTAGIAETLGLLNISRFSEKFGRQEVARSFASAGAAGEQFAQKNVFSNVFKKVFLPIGTAGAVEGVNSEFIQERARKQNVSPKNIVEMGAFGFGSASLLGGLIAGTAAAKSKVAKPLEIFGYGVDPFEYPGDKIADIQAKVTQKVTGKASPEPALFGLGGANKEARTVTFGVTTEASGPKKSPKAPKGSRTSSFDFTSAASTSTAANTNVATATTTDVNTRRNTIASLIGIPTYSNTPVPVPTDSSTPVPTPTFTPTPTDTFTTAPTSTNTDTNTETTTNTNTLVSANTAVAVPTPTPLWRLPVPLPFTIPFGSGSGGGRNRGPKYANELRAGLSQLTSGLGLGLGNIHPSVKKKVKALIPKAKKKTIIKIFDGKAYKVKFTPIKMKRLKK